MARKPAPAAPPLPPPSAAACWRVFLLWALGVPALVAAALGVIWLALWALGSAAMMPRTEVDMATVLLWLALIVLLYPVMLVIWVQDLRAGLRAARDWAALTPEAQAAALASAGGLAAAKRRRKGKRDD